MVDLNTILTGGAAGRPDSISGLRPEFAAALQQMIAAAPPEVQAQLRIMSAYRSPEVQAQLYKNAVAKYGSEAAARKWVAPPGRSQHNHGGAVDLSYLGPAAREWAHKNAAAYGLTFPMGHEPWHIELAGGRSAALAPGVAPAQNSSPSAAMQTATDSPEQAVAPNPFAVPMAAAEAATPFLGLLANALESTQPQQPEAPNIADVMAEMARAQLLAPPPQAEQPPFNPRPTPLDPMARGGAPRYFI